MLINVNINELTFSDGTTIRLDSNDIVVFVGANNVGKSVALKDIHSWFTWHPSNLSPNVKVITKITICKNGDDNDLSKWLNLYSSTKPDDSVFYRRGSGLTYNNAKDAWHLTHLHVLGHFFCNILNTENRLSAANPVQNIDTIKNHPTHSLHHMYVDDQLELNISKHFKEAFNLDLVLDRAAGSQIYLHCGMRPSPAPGEDRQSKGYTEKVRNMPVLHEQGDGMRSFTGTILNATALEDFIVLLDEPEAFLHPPQARLLGKILAKEKRREVSCLFPRIARIF